MALVRFSAPIVPKCFETGAQVLSDSCGGLLSVIPFAHSDLEGIMAHRRIGQEALRLDARAGRQTSLDELHALLDWAPADRALASVYGAAKGEKAWPPLAMFKALLLATWYDLSDVMLAEALEDRRASAAFVALPATKLRPSAPLLCASAASLSKSGSIKACLPPLRRRQGAAAPGARHQGGHGELPRVLPGDAPARPRRPAARRQRRRAGPHPRR